jgi:hypothetical protein
LSNSNKPLLSNHSAAWHHEKFAEFIERKLEIGEPSPHLAIMGYLTRNMSEMDRVWALGCYAATYCLPSAQVIWTYWTYAQACENNVELASWVHENWPGIVTRTERRCVRSPQKMYECLSSLARWVESNFSMLKSLSPELNPANYDRVWDSVSQIKFFGRYINIRFVEGLRRYCGIPAMLYDIRSIGGWSPKRALALLYPEQIERLLVDDSEGNLLTEKLARELLEGLQPRIPKLNEYILAAMLCEYKAGYENYKQYPGWTIDQEPLMYDKVYAYWGDRINKNLLWEARRALFPPEVLGELNNWNGTRWDLTHVLRDEGYIWSDLTYDYERSRGNLADPYRRVS